MPIKESNTTAERIFSVPESKQDKDNPVKDAMKAAMRKKGKK